MSHQLRKPKEKKIIGQNKSSDQYNIFYTSS